VTAPTVLGVPLRPWVRVTVPEGPHAGSVLELRETGPLLWWAMCTLPCGRVYAREHDTAEDACRALEWALMERGSRA